MENHTRVMVVDDVLCNRKLFARMLTRRFHFMVDMVASGPEALLLLETRVYTILFLDNVMPGMSGIEVAKKVRENEHYGTSAALAIIGITGNALQEDVEEFLRAGADHVLVKPISYTILRSLLCVDTRYTSQNVIIKEDQWISAGPNKDLP